MNFDPSREWDRYCDMEEERALAQMVDRLTEELKKLGSRHNQDCWPVCSFGGKDADLEGTGCTGIEEIFKAGEESFWMKVGGHKTIVPSDDESVADYEQEMVSDCGFAGDWTGDDWSLYENLEVSCEWIFGDNEVDFVKTAEAAYKAAQHAIYDFENAMVELEKNLDLE